jgi:hypothetical protein
LCLLVAGWFPSTDTHVFVFVFLLNLKQVFRFLPCIIDVQCKCAFRSCLCFSFSTYRNWYDFFVQFITCHSRLKLGLTLATSGLISCFRIHFRDSFGNSLTRALNASSVVVFASARLSAIPSDHFSRNMSRFDSISSPNALVIYYSQQKEDTSIRVMLLSAFGACATYYSTAPFSPHEPVPIISTIGTIVGNLTSDLPSWTSLTSSASIWSALYSPVSNTSLFWIVCADIKSVQLSISNVALLDATFDDPRSAASTLFSAPYLFHDMNAMYEIKLEYEGLHHASFVHLRIGPDFSSSVLVPTQALRCFSAIPNQERLSIHPAPACASTSTVWTLSIITVGVPSIASLRVVDEFFNSRTETVPWFAKICYTSASSCTNKTASPAFPACCDPIGFSLDNSLPVLLSKSGSARIVAEISCEKFQSATSMLERNCSPLNVSIAHGNVTFLATNLHSNCSSFKGFIDFVSPGEYYVSLQPSHGSAPTIWIGTGTASDLLVFNSSGFARVFITSSILKTTIDIEWSPTTSASFMSMTIFESNAALLPIGNSALAYRCQLNEVSIAVLGGETCASKSIVADANLTIVAGTKVTLGIISRDAFGNLNNPLSSFWTASAKFIFPEGVLGEDLVFAADLQPIAPSSFSLLVTRSGSYRVDVMKAEGNGLTSLFFENLDPDPLDYFADDVETGTDFQWNFSSAGSSAKKVFGCVRVVGWISSPVDDAISMRVESDGHYKVVMGDNLRIDCWSLNENCSEEISKNTAIWRHKVQGTLYPITIDIRPQWTSAAPYFRLLWFSTSMPLSSIPVGNLWASWTSIFSSPLLLFVEPASISPGTSMIITDSSFSVATAGVASCFSISSVDFFGNSALNDVNVRTLDSSRWMIGGTANGLPVALSYAVHPNNPSQGHHHMTIVSTQASTVSLFASYADISQSGFWATMYADSSFRSATMSVFIPGSLHYTSIRSILNASVPVEFLLSSTINVKFSAAFQPSSMLLHTFKIKGPSHVSYMNMTINHLHVSSRNSTLPFVFFTPTSGGFVKIAIFITFDNDGPFGLYFTLPEQPMQYVAPYAAIDVDRPPVQWHVKPSVAHLSSKTLQGMGLSIATVGTWSGFYVSAADEYGNIRSSFDSRTGVHCSIRSNNFISSWMGTSAAPSFVKYLITRSGSYVLSVKLESSVLDLDLLVVGEGTPGADWTSVSGNSLSIGTSGVGATFSVSARDGFKQIITAALENVFVRIHSSDFDEKHTVGIRYIRNTTGLESYVSNTVSFRTTRSGMFFIYVKVAENAGLNAIYRISPLQPSKIIGSQYESSIFQCTRNQAVPFHMIEFLPSYNGFIRSEGSGVYTFQFSSVHNIERLILNIDDQQLIDTSISSTAVASATVALGAATLYSLRIELSAVITLDRMCLQWKYNSSFLPIPSSNLYSNANHVRGSPFSLTVHPAAFCATASRAFGSGISLATVGQTTTFFILLRDVFGNNVTYNQSQHGLAVHLRYRISVPTLHKSLSRGVINQFAQSLAIASYRTYVVRNSHVQASAEWQEMTISNAVAGYLIATYYSVMDGGRRVNFTAMNSNAFNYDSSFLVSFSGFFSRDSSEWKSVKLTIPTNAVLRSSTTVLGFQLAEDVASNSTHASSVVFDINSLEAGCLGDVYIEISGHAGSGMSLLRFDYVNKDNVSQIPSDKLFARYDIPVNTMYGSGLMATYYKNSTSWPISSFGSSAVQWSTSTQNGRPFELPLSGEHNVLRWNGMLAVTRPSVYTFFASKAAEDDISMSVNGLSFLEPSYQSTLARGTILIDEPLVFEILIVHLINSSASSHKFALSFSCCRDAQAIPVPESALTRKMAAYTVDFDDKSSYDWPSGMDDRHSSDGMPMARGSGKIYANSAQLLVLPANEISETGSFIEAGSLKTSALAGVYSTFQVNARDQWLNPVSSSASSNLIASRLVRLNAVSTDEDFNPAFMISAWDVDRNSEFFSVSSPHQLFYMSTRSGVYSLQTIVARTEGMVVVVRPGIPGQAKSSWSSDARTVLQKTTNISLDGLDGMLIQCSALLKIDESGYVTIYVHTNAHFVLQVDGKILINAASINEREWLGEFWSPGYALHNILLRIENPSSISKRVLIQYSTANVVKQLIPADALAPSYLFIGASSIATWKVGPVDIFDYTDFPTPPLVFPQIYVHPAAVCASVSFVNISSAFATAGFPSTFHINALDMYGNQRSPNDDCFTSKYWGLFECFFVVIIPDGSNAAKGLSSLSEIGHQFPANVVVTTAGASFDEKVASAVLVQRGGLATTYFCDNWFGEPRVSLAQPPVLIIGSGMYVPAPIYNCRNNGIFSVRWSGFLHCTSEGVGTVLASAASSVRIHLASKQILAIENDILWSTSATSASATFASNNVIMDVMIEYVSTDSRQQFFRLDFFCNSSINSTPSYLYGSPVKVSPRFVVIPGTTCASNSHVWGSGLSIATSGGLQFVWMSFKDSFGNAVEFYNGRNADDIVTASLYPMSGYMWPSRTSLPPLFVPNVPMNCGLCRITKASEVMLSVSQPSLAFVPEKVGDYKLVVSVGHKYGLTATFYSSCSPTASDVKRIEFPFAFSRSRTQIRDSLPSNFVCNASVDKGDISLPVAVRWQGFMVFPYAPMEYRLFATGDGDFAVWYESTLLLDKRDGPWSATVFVHADKVAYDVEIRYYSNSSNCWFNLGWESDLAHWGSVWPSVLHSRNDIPTNGMLDVLGKGSVTVVSIENGTNVATESEHNFAVNSMVVFVISGFSSLIQTLHCSAMHLVTATPSPRSFKVSSDVNFPDYGQLTVVNAFYVALSSSVFATTTSHGFISGDVITFVDYNGTLYNRGSGENSVWNCLSSTRDYVVASTPTSTSFTLADTSDELKVAIPFSCNSSNIFIVRKSLQHRLIVKSGSFCASQSFFLGQILSLATAGLIFSYPVQLRDSFQNIIAQNASLISVNCFDSITDTAVNHMQTSIFMHNGHPTVFISTTVSGSYNIAIFDVANGAPLQNSPVLMRVNPQAFCAASSRMQRIMTSIIMNWASRMEFYAADVFGNRVTEALAGYTTNIASCMPDAGLVSFSVTSNGGLGVTFTKSFEACSCCTNLHISLASGPILNGNGASSIFVAENDAAGVLTGIRSLREGSGYVATPAFVLISRPLFAVKMVLVNGSDSITMVLAYSDVKISNGTYSVLHSYPANPGRGRVLTAGLALVHGGLLATYYALDAQLPLNPGTNVFGSSSWAAKLTPCLAGVMGRGVTMNPASCHDNSAAVAVKFSGVVHREGRMAPLVMFMAVYNSTLLTVFFASRAVSNATTVVERELGLLFYSAVVPMVPSNYQKILTDIHVEYVGERIPSFSFPLFAGTACSKVLTISSIATVTIGNSTSNTTVFHTDQAHAYSANATIVRLLGSLPPPFSHSVLYQVVSVHESSAFSLSILGGTSALFNVTATSYSESTAFVEEVHGACGMRAPYELGSAYVNVALV